MKKETKELIKWLKDHLSHYRNQLAAGQIKVGPATGEDEVRKSYEVINFLNSLPEIESHLCNGGYIQDKNGTPCCHGDEVMVIDEKGKDVCGVLVWGDTGKSFSIQNSKLRQVYYFPVQFEKVGK